MSLCAYVRVGAALLGLVLAHSISAETLTRPRADFGKAKPSVTARRVADWVVASGDHRGKAFFVIDKRNARLFVFDARGRIRGTTPILLGLARGDHTVPGIGERPLSSIKPHERTTPAGRFDAEPGRNANGEDIVWVDYDAAVSMHRVRPTNPAERRLQRLASRTAADNRISYGCINVPAKFYNSVVSDALRPSGPVVYILPEVQPVSKVFAGIAAARTGPGQRPAR